MSRLSRYLNCSGSVVQLPIAEAMVMCKAKRWELPSQFTEDPVLCMPSSRNLNRWVYTCIRISEHTTYDTHDYLMDGSIPGHFLQNKCLCPKHWLDSFYPKYWLDENVDICVPQHEFSRFLFSDILSEFFSSGEEDSSQILIPFISVRWYSFFNINN